MIGFSTIQSVAQVAGGRLVTGLAAGLILAALTAMLIRVFRSSSTRFAVCFLTLVAVAVLPLVACFVSGNTNVVGPASGVVVPARWELSILGLWIVGAGIGLSRIAVGLWRVRRIRRSSVELETSSASDSPLASRSLRNPTDIMSKRKVALCISDEVSVPTAIGFFRPAVLFPSWAIKELSASELNSILLHELGHLLRWDDWTNLAQKVVQALLFFHPAVWWIDSRLALEREAACDDLVVAKTCDARGYAKCLVSVAEKSMGRRGFALAVAAVSRMRETAIRLTRLLDKNRPGGFQLSKPAIAGFATLTLALLFEMPRVPSIIVFREASPVTVANQASPAVVDDAHAIPAVIPVSAQVETVASERLAHPMLRNAELRTRLASETPGRTSSVQAKRVRVNRVQINDNRKPAPALVRASYREDRAPAFLLVTQTVTCDDSGDCFVSIRAWQVFTKQTTDQTQGNGPKSI